MRDDDRFPAPFSRREAIEAFSALADRPTVNVETIAHRITIARMTDGKRQAALTAALARALK